MSDGQRQPVGLMSQEAASLLHLIGGMGAHHLVLVGGMVPPLLVESPEEPHAGTADIDLCLSVALTAGATNEYYKSIEERISPFFEPADGSSFRWKKKDSTPGHRLLVDFLGPEVFGESDADGMRALSDETAVRNVGPRLRPYGIKAAELIEIDAEIDEVDVKLLYKSPTTRAKVTVRHAGPVGFLAAKAFALDNRDEDKDGYDVAWFCINADPDPVKVAKILTARPAFHHPLVPEALELLLKAFSDGTYQGPTGYASIVTPNPDPKSDDFARHRHEAYLATSAVLDELRRSITWEKVAAYDAP